LKESSDGETLIAVGI